MRIKTIKKLSKQSKEEIKKYIKTGDETYLLQSAEKVWMMYCLLVEHLSKKDIRTPKGISIESWKLIKEGKIPRLLYERASFLHSYHYECRAEDKLIMDLIKYANREILRRLK